MALSAGNDQNQTTSRILNKLQYAMTDVAADITTAATSDIVLMLDASDSYEPQVCRQRERVRADGHHGIRR